jgi:hypothetical protein
MKNKTEMGHYLDTFSGRKVQEMVTQQKTTIFDNLDAWIAHYLQLAVVGVRMEAITQKIRLCCGSHPQYAGLVA